MIETGGQRESSRPREPLEIQMAVNFALLFCRSALQSLYEHLGWVNVSSPVWVEQIQGDILLPMAAMVRCLGSEPWPNGEVRLGSRPW